MTKKKINLPPDTYGYYYYNKLWFSDAYKDLTKSAMRLLHLLINELRYDGYYKKKKVWTNNGLLSFTEGQYRKIYKSSSETYIRSRNQLIRNGLIKQTYRGGYGKGDRSRYKLLFIDGVPFGEQRWLSYPVINWESDIPKMKKQTIGVKTQFKKGKSGRKSFSTLQNRNLKGQNNPNKSNPRK